MFATAYNIQFSQLVSVIPEERIWGGRCSTVHPRYSLRQDGSHSDSTLLAVSYMVATPGKDAFGPFHDAFTIAGPAGSA